MLTANRSWFNWSFLTLVLLGAAFSCRPMQGQYAPSVRVGGLDVTGIPHDWSHRYVKFSNPGTEQEAISRGQHEQWLKIVNDPRYVLQQLYLHAPVQGPASVDAEYRLNWISEARGGGEPATARTSFASASGSFALRFQPIGIGRPNQPTAKIKRDWSQALGGPGLAAGQFPATYSTSATSASCTDFAVYPTGASSGATIVAFNNIYVNACSGGPTVAWAYNTGGTARLSPVISFDGTQVAYIQTSSSVASLVLLKVANSGGSVASPTFGSGQGSVLNGSYRSCVAPCYTTFTLSGSPNDTNSAPFYAYSASQTDQLFVADNSGKLHQFTGVFNGTPSEVTANWPVTVTSTAANETLTSPVYDGSTYVFIGDSAGYLHSVNVSTRATVVSNKLDNNTNGGFVDPPVVDSTNGFIYAFVGDGGSNHSYVNKFTSGFAGSTYGTANVSLGNTTDTSTVARAGAFDNEYYQGAGATGNLYTCVNGAVYQIDMTSFSSATAYNTPVSTVADASTCSPVTEAYGAVADTSLSASVSATLTTTTLAEAINHATASGTTLSAAITTTTATSITVTSSTNILVGDYITVDSETMYVSGRGGTGNRTLTVTRHANGTSAATHSSGATVTTSITLITVATGASISTGNYIQIDTEILLVGGTSTTTGIGGLTVSVTRGALSTTAATHTSGSTVTVLTQLSVASATGISTGDYIQVGSELFKVLAISGTTLTTNRAQIGTTAAAHTSGADAADVKDWLFVSVAANGNTAGCTGGCVFNYSVLGAGTTGAPTAGLQETGGTSGIVIDNQLLPGGADGYSQIYFSTLTGNTAVQASQSALQ